MKVLSVDRGYGVGVRPAFCAKLSNITIKDEVAQNVTKFIDEMKVIAQKNYPSEITVGKTHFKHSRYCAGWQSETDKRYISVDFDRENKLYSVFIINKENDKNGKEIIKTFDYYLGTPTAMNPIPEISYSEFETGNYKKGLWQNIYKDGTTVPDNIADLMNKVIESTLKFMGIK